MNSETGHEKRRGKRKLRTIFSLQELRRSSRTPCASDAPDTRTSPIQDGFQTDLALTRPKTRGECVSGLRPCPWLSCRYHLALEVKKDGTIASSLPLVDGELDLAALPETCSLDVADRVADGRASADLDEVGAYMGFSREMTRIVQAQARRTCVELLTPLLAE